MALDRGMKKVLFILVAVVLAAGIVQQVSRGSFDTAALGDPAPWYYKFERDCRQDGGLGMADGCLAGVEQVFQELRHNNVRPSCDLAQFWKVSDEKASNPGFLDLDWRAAVKEILADPTVCKSTARVAVN